MASKIITNSYLGYCLEERVGEITHQGGFYNEMGYLIHLVRCALKKKIMYSLGRLYISRKYIWYKVTYKAYRTFGSYNTIYQILSNVWAISKVRT